MKRRRVLGSLGALLVPLAGCVTGDDASSATGTTRGTRETPSGDPTGTPTSGSALTPPRKPARPDTVDPDAVLDYVERYEHAVLYDELYGVDATEVSVSCEAVLDERTDLGVYAFAGCRGTARYADDVVADDASVAAYFVDTGTTRRIGPDALERRTRPVEAVYAAADPAENVNPPGGSTAGFRVYNVGGTDRHLSVTVTYLDAAASERALSEEYTVPPAEGTWQDDVTVRTGNYRIEARLDGSTTATHPWRVTGSPPGYTWGTTAVYLTPDGDVTVRETPVREVVG